MCQQPKRFAWTHQRQQRRPQQWRSQTKRRSWKRASALLKNNVLLETPGGATKEIHAIAMVETTKFRPGQTKMAATSLGASGKRYFAPSVLQSELAVQICSLTIASNLWKGRDCVVCVTRAPVPRHVRELADLTLWLKFQLSIAADWNVARRRGGHLLHLDEA